MPFRRRGVRRFGRRRRGGLRKPRSTRSYMGYVRYVPWLVRGFKMLKGLVNAELKYKDTSGSGVAIANTGTVVHLTNIDQGDQQGQRNGISVKGKSLFGRINIQQSSSATSSTVRMVVFQDTQNQGTTPGVSDVLESTSIVSPLSRIQAGRFVVLIDKTVTLEINGDRNYNTKLRKSVPFHVKWSGTVGTDEKKNQLYFLFISDEPTNTPTMVYYWRYNYYDN